MKEHAEPHELVLDCFQQPLFEISIIVWEDTPYSCEGMPNLQYATCLTFAFCFSTPQGDPTGQSLLVTARAGFIPVKLCENRAECFSAFMHEHYHELVACEISDFSLVRIDNLYRPFITPHVHPVWVKRGSLVIRPKEKLVGIFLWLYHGFLLAIVYGNFDETAVLYGDQALKAFQEAQEYAKAGKLTIRTRDYEVDTMHADSENILNEVTWFGYFPESD